MRNIVLTGFMGAGKTTVSEELVRLTGLKSVEVDAEIEKSAGMSIPEIFEKFGEPRFREMETGEIRRLSGGQGLVISTGGGAVMREENMAALRQGGGVVVCLRATPETILKRTSGNSDRPLLQVEDPLRKISELLEMRNPYYERADVMVDTDGKTPFEVAREVLEKIGWDGEKG